MQTIAFEANLTDGQVRVPPVHRDWYDRRAKVILLEQTRNLPDEEDAWTQIQSLRTRLKQGHRHFSDSAQSIREERER
uniref:Uncharacterized protein n=1 Tax=Candidatus Kentrum sp. DK TaxID=2126562 RepID=A0A450S6D3_9GAMM|nr:MAG: hypothetical protein BECKDK2373C_GA0170839_101835 [Candidatus Kentron sp. DK]